MTTPELGGHVTHRNTTAVLHRFPPELSAAEDGMSTAEYAVGTVAACGFGALLFKILTSGFATSLLESLISRALHLGL
jgi:hypothetical protein